ncbi:hybrid sensor histidine kinase/response regulator [Methylobacter sp. YRD-M1]|uniref:hybrid sensor histidine kinase/response regulator n=1 Tax=Methylobacter sp. YRD-M1 TaxID=2911520 RepID=UPI00227C6BC8|nr:PAS domain-containing sensor histidine kinase [Methylobacter sp. YRD-M1]WAK01541.1 PAS domain S-box protein [Methylobacter sp. YRD-M1]
MLNKVDKFYELRQRAKELLTAPDPLSPSHSMEELCELLQELDTHRIELELQNDELLKTQQQLQDTTQEYLDFYNYSPVGYLTLNSEGVILKANMTLVDLFGVEKQAIINKPFSDFVLDSDQDILYFYRRALLNHQSAQSCELRLRRSDGQTLWVKLDGLPQTVQRERIFRLALTDIHHLKETEELLSKSEADLRAIFDNVLDVIIKIDQQGIINSVNAAAESVFGFSAEELSGCHISRLLPQFDWSEYEAPPTLLSDDRGVQIAGIKRELEGLKKNGVKFPAILGISVISSAHQPRCFIITIHDITERKQMEIALQQADRRKNEFLAMLGHELRNPLAPIRNAVQVLKNQHSENPTLDWCSKIIERQVSHMASLLNDLLDVARIMQDKITLKIDHVDFNEIIDSAIETNAPLIQARHQELATSRPDMSMWVEGDRVRLTQALSNLLNNATKYTDEGGKISLEVMQENDDLIIRVQDNGSGISPEILPCIFELFTQADSTLARSQGGLGLGLPLTRRLVEMHGGTVTACSAGNQQGSKFTMRLPLSHAAVTQSTQPETAPSAVKLRILLIDDNPDVAESLALLLQIEGHEVDTADRGLKGIEKAQSFRPQAVLLDIGLPDLSGYEVAKRLRELPETRQACLVAISGYGQPEDHEQSKSAGFDHHLLKPVDSSSLFTLLTTLKNQT